MLVKTVVNKSNTAIIIKFNWKINDKNLTENNKNKLWKLKKNNKKQTILYFDTFSWNVCKDKYTAKLCTIIYLCAIYSSRGRSVYHVLYLSCSTQTC